MDRQGAATTDGRAQPPADQLLAHLRPEQPGGHAVQGPAQGCRRRGQGPAGQRLRGEGEIGGDAALQPVEAAQGQSRAQQPLTGRWHGGQGVLKAPQQGLPQPRHADQVLRPHPLQIGPQLLEGRVGLRAAAGEQEVFGAALIGMPDRQHAQHPVAGAGGNGHPEAAHLVQQVGVGEGHALWLAGGAGGVQQRRQPAAAPHLLQVAGVRQPGGHGGEVGGFALAVQHQGRAIDLAVGREIKGLRLQHVGHASDGIRVQQDAAQHGFLRLQVLGGHPIGGGFETQAIGAAAAPHGAALPLSLP